MPRALPQFDAYIARATQSGLICSSCGAEFVTAHDEPTACRYCYARLTLAERSHVIKATHEEVNRAAHAADGRKRKQARKA